MRISELSRVSGVPLPTVKFYLREGLLPPGTPTARNQADYGEGHLHRLRLVRVLQQVGGLRIAGVRAVLGAIEDGALPLHEVLGVAQYALGPHPDDPAGDLPDVRAALREVDGFLADLGWNVKADAPGRRMLADAVVALRRLGMPCSVETFAPYARDADAMARREVAGIPVDASRDEAVQAVVAGTVVYEAALVALHRLADEHHSSLRFATAR